MHSRFTRWAVGATVALSLFGAVGVAQASSLTSAQVSAIIGLLQSFGADQSVINSVSATLGGQTSSALSCASFTDVSYGNFDNNSGGRVSQLQTWLGIPSSTFGFGTYGNKTRAAWNAQCGGVQQNNSQTTTSTTPSPSSANATSNVVSPVITALSTATATIGTQIIITGDGFMHLPTGTSATIGNYGNYISLKSPSSVFGDGFINSIDSLDGKTIVFTVPSYVDAPAQSYSNGGVGALPPHPLVSGLYQLSVGNSHGVSNPLPITFSVPVSPSPTVAIDQSPLVATGNTFVLTGSATNVSQITIQIATSSSMSACAGGNFPVVNGRWSANMAFVNCLPAMGTYNVLISNPQTYQNLATGLLIMNTTQNTAQSCLPNTTGIYPNCTTVLLPTVTINQNSLTSSTNIPTITGTATNMPSSFGNQLYIHYKAIGGTNGGTGGYFQVVNGQWSWSAGPQFPFSPGTYTIDVGDPNIASRVLTTGTLTVTVTSGSTATPTATIDQSSLADFATYPTFTGSATGANNVIVYVTQGSTFNVTLIGQTSVPVVNGRWSFRAGTEAPRGSYTVRVLDANNPDRLLASAMYTANSSTPSVTIDSSSLVTTTSTDYTQITITGNATNVSTLNVSISNQNGKQAQSNETAVASGHWSAALSALPAGTYSVSVYAGNGNSVLLATGTLTVNTNRSTLTATVSTNVNARADGSTIISGTLQGASTARVTVTEVSSGSLKYDGTVQALLLACFGCTIPSWTIPATFTLTAGQYRVNVYDQSNNLLTSQIIQITAPPVVYPTPTATIDQSSLMSLNGAVTLAGSASNLNPNDPTSGYLTVGIVPSTYSGDTAMYWVGGFIRNNNSSSVRAFEDFTVNGGRWAASFTAVPQGSYKVYVYGTNVSGSPILLTNGVLTVSAH